MRATMLHAARRLVEPGEIYAGPISVTVDAPDDGMSLTVVPRPGVDGLEEGLIPGVGAGAGQEGFEVSREELLRVLFSEEERRIIRALTALGQGKASDVMERSKIEKSKFWVLWGNLQQREIVGDADEGEGFVVLPAWVREVVGEGSPEKGPT